MQDNLLWLYITVFSFGAVLTMSLVALRGWREWIALKRMELERHRDDAPPSTTSRIEVADLKERIRKLEAIAAGVEL